MQGEHLQEYDNLSTLHLGSPKLEELLPAYESLNQCSEDGVVWSAIPGLINTRLEASENDIGIVFSWVLR